MSGPEQIPEKSDRKPWKISPKTPNSVLKDSHTVNLYSAMTVDVNNNVRELVPSVDWNEVIWLMDAITVAEVSLLTQSQKVYLSEA